MVQEDQMNNQNLALLQGMNGLLQCHREGEQ